jgi:ABC-type proline/glycine betaine transport system permease subunit
LQSGSVDHSPMSAARCTVEGVSKRARVLSFGFAAALVVAGGLCAAFVGGVTGEVLTIVLIAAGLGGALLLIFLEIGFDEERELARDEERRGAGKRPAPGRKASSQHPRWPRRPG